MGGGLEGSGFDEVECVSFPPEIGRLMGECSAEGRRDDIADKPAPKGGSAGDGGFCGQDAGV